MSTPKHTPGPWRTLANAYIGQWQVLSSESKICTVSKKTLDRSLMAEYPDLDKEASANARLIAAAPELLAACELMADNWGAVEAPAIVAQARAAIDKARGQS